ncbi:MAG: hypothetical protein ACJ8J0_15560 [Longimicrobiaceae bacterium]
MAAPQSNPTTTPSGAKARAGEEVFSARATVSTGVATKYWLELLAYPPGSARSLWLQVGGTWLHLDNPDPGTQISVQGAFCSCPDRLEVAVWYSGDVIVGLVVRSK